MVLIRNYREQEGICIFDESLDEKSTYAAQHLEVIARAEPDHFWFQCRRDKICQTFLKHVDKNARILEIGGGTGFVAEKLIKLGFSVELADIHSNGLHYAQKKGIHKLYQFDLFSPPFEAEFDVICLFDVLEHLREEQLALTALKKMLKTGGQIILTVPAHQWLWSSDDVIAGHHRRYSKQSLRALFLQCGFKQIEVGYFFIMILPLLLLRRFVKKEVKEWQIDQHPLLNPLLQGVTKLEFHLQRFLPNLCGGSLLAVVQEKQKIDESC